MMDGCSRDSYGPNRSFLTSNAFFLYLAYIQLSGPRLPFFQRIFSLSLLQCQKMCKSNEVFSIVFQAFSIVRHDLSRWIVAWSKPKNTRNCDAPCTM